MDTERPDSERNAPVDSPLPRLKSPRLQSQPTSHPWIKAATYGALILLGAGLGIAGNQLIAHSSFLQTSQPQALANVPVAPQIASTQADFITNVVEKVGPAVVRIDATHTVSNPQASIFSDPFFRQFFGDQLPSQPPKEIERGVGSGFIINTNGDILTNAHVVDGVKTVTVTLKDGRTFQGKVLGSDPVTDIAVVKIDATQLPTIALGDSNRIKPGEWAIAIGNPLGLNNTVTAGIISATGRSSGNLGFANERVNFIQTDAAINPGNSGGPLLNAQGQAIGINTAIIKDAQGIGFAVPIDQAKTIADQLIATGKVAHPYLGIQLVTLTPDVQNEINRDPNSGLSVSQSQGVLVAKVIPDSPAAKAGLRAGDVIQQVNGQPVKTAE